MFKKPLIIASTAALIATATFSTQAKAGDPIFGALIGGAFGAALGHAVDGRHGARVGAGIGALAGAVSSSHSGYYDRGYGYDGGYGYSPGYSYAPAPAYGYYAPAYPRATIVYNSGGRYYDRHRSHRHRDRHDRRWR
jgi:hypothetical protein